MNAHEEEERGVRHNGRYILDADGRTAIPEPDLLRWGRWFETSFDDDRRRVGLTFLADGALRVSTVFLGLDHSFGSGRPVLWETVVFVEVKPAPAPLAALAEAHEERYETWEAARAGHEAIVAAVAGTLELW